MQCGRWSGRLCAPGVIEDDADFKDQGCAAASSSFFLRPGAVRMYFDADGAESEEVHILVAQPPIHLKSNACASCRNATKRQPIALVTELSVSWKVVSQKNLKEVHPDDEYERREINRACPREELPDLRVNRLQQLLQ